MSAPPLTVLGHVALGKATPLHFHKAFPFFYLKKTDVSIGSQKSSGRIRRPTPTRQEKFHEEEGKLFESVHATSPHRITRVLGVEVVLA